VLEAGSGTKFQLLPFFNIVGPFLDITKNLGAHQWGSTALFMILSIERKIKLGFENTIT
jgi:hypothetical protein